MGCFCSWMSHFLNNLISRTFCFIIASLALFRAKLASRLKIIWQSYFDAILMTKIHNKHIIAKAEKYPIKILNVMSHNRAGLVVLSL